MTEKDLKEQLKMAYSLPESDSRNRFIRAYQKRSLQLGTILRIELEFMGIRSVFAGIFLFIILYAGYRSHNPDFTWHLSCVIPAAALMPMTALGRSERYKMSELEAASRFSACFVRLVRLMILGIFSLIVLICVCFWQAGVLQAGTGEILLTIAIPYLINVYGGVAISRKWHGRESIFGIIAVCMISCVLPAVIRNIRLQEVMPAAAVVVITIAVVLGIAKECMIYVKESEKTIWNLC